ncbi:hypothetical protein EJ05DRAFT_484992 [Pseudovirgaria hyperparasitica]|uniref:Uncharacterized protein n=1 Tax=Pseudovirgaria hyperparasitica TaxID=470096 RepID=A0A6A6WBB6_9PEZI|nr:uncharacterized protein EJ05DRAFT_484992 [Pseudovirgaria hyperparasitica]KAF2758897.1 hypothetical protein EJ05DRAFT_484992 [Pseudovirgaria hyperparasitica]
MPLFAASKEAINESITPSGLQVAFALAIVRSKPADVSVREYMMRLRGHLKEGPLYRQRSPQWVVDQVAFWKSQHEAAEESRSELQARVTDLEQKIKLLKDPTDAPESPSGAAHTTSVKSCKRKQSVSTRPAKKPKLNSDISGPTSQTAITTHLEPLHSIAAFGDDGITLLRSVMQVQCLCKSSEPDAPNLSFHLASIASSIGGVLKVVIQRHHQETDVESNARVPGPVKARRKAASDIAHVIRAIACAFSTLLLGLSNIPRQAAFEDPTAHVVYCCARMFQVALKAIVDSAESKAARSSIDTTGTGSQLGKTKPKSRQNTPQAQDLGRAITQFLNACLSALDPSQSSHRDIFEALMYVLLERVGRRIYCCTFSHERGQSVDDDIRLGGSGCASDEQGAKSLAYEAPYLISILEKSFSLAPQLLGPVITSMQRTKTAVRGKQSTASKTTSVPKVLLHTHAKELLQQTLVNGIFGSNEGTTADNCLHKPLPSSKIPTVPHEYETHTADWFRQQVWQVVGWGILGREADW